MKNLQQKQKQVLKHGRLIFVPYHGKTEIILEDKPYQNLQYKKNELIKTTYYGPKRGQLIVTGLYPSPPKVKKTKTVQIETDSYSQWLIEN